MQNNSKFVEVEQERDDLKQQIKVYNTLKDNYLQTGATQQEQQLYKELMQKIVLLKEEAGNEKVRLKQEAIENAKKEVALNKYQQIIRNVINSNMIASARIKRRDHTIKENYQDIDDLKADVDAKKKKISRGNKKIKKLNSKLNLKVAQLKKSYQQNKISKEKMNQKIQKLRQKNNKKVKQLQAVNKQAQSQITKNQKIIQEVTQNLAQAERTIASNQASINSLKIEKQKMMQNVSSLREEFQNQMKMEKEAFEKEMEQQKLSAKAKQKKQEEFLASAKEKQDELAQKIQGMESEALKAQGKLDEAEKEKSALAEKSKELEAQAQNLKEDKDKLSSDIKGLKELAQAKQKIISDMKKNLAKSGLKADVDDKTGDVVISFGNEYFDTGKASLKPGMRQVLKKFMPSYTKTLFSDPKTAEKVASIEIVGFASPTYKGKYVNPISLKADNKAAVNYNLDLSYYRARSIFDYIFDTGKMKYKHQKKLLPIVKVTGRSFLAEGVTKRAISSMSHSQYCKKFDCKKSQKVLIRFNLEN